MLVETKASQKPSKDNTMKRIIAFLNEIGIENELTQDQFESFLPGVKIENGKLRINEAFLLFPGDVLHEAGHLACLPPEIRPQANDNITDSLGQDYSYEMAVILWTYAAAKRLNISVEQVFHSEGYKGEAKWLTEQFENQVYIGLPMLQWLGLAASDTEVASGEAKPFPEMLKWTRTAD